MNAVRIKEKEAGGGVIRRLICQEGGGDVKNNKTGGTIYTT